MVEGVLAEYELAGVSGGGSNPPGVEGDSEFADLLQQVIAAAPEQTFEIRLTLVGEWRE